jgi:iron complex outermembrane recepter protein
MSLLTCIFVAMPNFCKPVIFLAIHLFIFLLTSYSQQLTITVMGANNKPVASATVSALLASDTTQRKQKVTDTSGRVVFAVAKGAQYLIRASSVGYVPAEKGVTITGNNAFTIALKAGSATLGGVVVTASRPIMRQEDDKTIVDPENLASSSTNAYEILEKTPGLFVDQDGNVYLSSTTPSRIYINGREQRLSTADIATMLKSLPPNSIQSIEILRTPSARYDASGGGGIVNIVLKKGVNIGRTGSISGGINQGKYGNQFVGLNLNNSMGKWNSYINTQYSRRKSYEQIKTDRLFAADSVLNQDANTVYPGSGFYVGVGAGYQFNAKWEMNYDARISINSSENSTNNTSVIRKISNNSVVTNNDATVETNNKSTPISQSLSLKYKIDSSGSEWTTDVSNVFSPSESQQAFVNTYKSPVSAVIGGNGNIDTRFEFYSVASNALLKMPKKLSLETGFKSTFANFSNNTAYTRQVNGTVSIDKFRTASFKYKENINAGYVQASKNFNGIILKVGTRLENTNMEGHQLVPTDTSFSIHRTDLFPYVYLSRSLMKIMTYDLRAYLVYRRTINRPSYELLNPFPRYIDQYLFETGNPSLRPQFTQNYEANISVDERPIFALGVNDTKDIFTNVIYQADSSKSLAYRTYDNLGTNKETYFRLLGAIPPGKRYFIVVGGQYNHNKYNGLYEGKPLTFTRGSWSIFSYQTLKITKTTQLTVNGFARFNGQLQFYELSSFGALNMSLTQQLLKRKLTITLSGTDILFTNNNQFTINQGSVNAAGYREADTRRVGLNIRYNFGLRKREENNMFNIESPESKQ